MLKPPIYAKSFKIKALKLVLEAGYSITKASHKLIMPESTLRKWVIQDRKQKITQANQSTQAKIIRIMRLEKEVRRLQMACEILKKVASFAAKPPERNTYSYSYIGTNFQ